MNRLAALNKTDDGKNIDFFDRTLEKEKTKAKEDQPALECESQINYDGAKKNYR